MIRPNDRVWSQRHIEELVKKNASAGTYPRPVKVLSPFGGILYVQQFGDIYDPDGRGLRGKLLVEYRFDTAYDTFYDTLRTAGFLFTNGSGTGSDAWGYIPNGSVWSGSDSNGEPFTATAVVGPKIHIDVVSPPTGYPSQVYFDYFRTYGSPWNESVYQMRIDGNPSLPYNSNRSSFVLTRTS